MPGCIVSATTASFRSMENRRRWATPVITSTFENASDIGVCLGLSLGPPAIAGVRSKRGAVQDRRRGAVQNWALPGSNARRFAPWSGADDDPTAPNVGSLTMTDPILKRGGALGGMGRGLSGPV